MTFGRVRENLFSVCQVPMTDTETIPRTDRATSQILRTSELCETLTKSRLFFFNPEFKEDTSLVLRC